MVVGIEKVILNEHFICLRLLLGKLFWKKIHDAIAEVAKPLVPYFEVSHAGFVKSGMKSNVLLMCIECLNENM